VNLEYMQEKERVFPVIKARENFLLKEIPSHHPSSIKYLKFWKEQKKRCIEGFWAKDKGDNEWRYMPPNLYFYVNFGTILHKPEGAARTASKQRIRPYLRDMEWAFFYNFIEARGFSGFKDDEEYSCCRDIKLAEKGEIKHEAIHKTCFNKKGELKTFIPIRDYVRKLWGKPMGLPLYFNEARNMMLLGSRGGGKSYLVGVGVILYEVLFDSAKEYTEESIKNPAVAEVFAGSSISAKSSDILSKTYDAYVNLPGVWAKGTEDEIPSPFYKDMAGSLRPNNMKSPWKHSYEKKVAGKWQKFGSGSHVLHGIWTTENPEAAAGTRPAIIVCEEVGLTANILTIHGSNTACQMTDGTDKFGSSIYIGTGGNMEKIIESETIFRDPEGFDMLAFDDEWEDSGKISWFVSAPYMDGRFKDEQGNTIEDAAIENYRVRRENKKKARSRTALDLELMNYPLVPSEMFLNAGHNRFPIADIKQRYSELLSSSKILDATWKGRFKINDKGTVKWENTKEMPIYEYPVKDNQDIHGAGHMFEPPKRGTDGNITYGRYIAGLDPVDDDDDNAANSLQSFFVMDVFTDRIVFEYSARTRYASEFYEQVRRALLYYNATVNYENQKKGFYAYMKNKTSLYLLAETPEILRDMDIQKTSRTGNKGLGTSANVAVNNWGLELQLEWLEGKAYDRTDELMNLYLIKSPAYLRELILFDGKRNTDRVSAMGMLLIYRQDKLRSIQAIKNKPKVDDSFGAKILSDVQKSRKRYNPHPGALSFKRN